ncbi:uncharacterized protein ACBT57_023520 [Dama dama]
MGQLLYPWSCGSESWTISIPGLCGVPRESSMSSSRNTQHTQSDLCKCMEVEMYNGERRKKKVLGENCRVRCECESRRTRAEPDEERDGSFSPPEWGRRSSRLHAKPGIIVLLKVLLSF